DVIARVGGDEFVVVTLGKSGSQLLAMGDRIISTLARPFEFEGRQCWYGASAGIAISDGTDLEAQQLLAKADLALYRAKRRGRARVEIFSDEMQREMRESQELADGIQSGLDRQEFVPWYQPQISAADFSICGVEALARWLPPDGSVRTPAEFLPATEELNKVQAIDRMILEAALRDLARWDEAGVEVPRLSVNVSARRLVEPDLAASLAALRPPRGRLAFELLESVFLDDVERTMAWNIDLLKEMGVEIELDDFGSGHASIISLVRLGPDAIKIDRRMAAGIIEDPSRRSLAAAIVGIGKSLGVKVVAEGVESLEQALILAELGCDRLQGFYFARPMPASDVPGFIAKWRDPRVGAIAVAG
ncbi:MAG: bifunctional diguanylate cyclase/phosphodiesterase, partial [Pseudomonadota bacterium]